MNKHLLVSVILTLLFFSRCQKEVVEPQIYPRISTLEVTSISTEGATLNAELLALGSSPVIEYGFLWDTIPSIHYDRSEKIELKENLSKGKFNCRINASLIKWQKYFVKAFVKTEDFLVIGKVVSFISNGSEPPKIDSFSPKSANWGDTIFIKGEKFSFKSNEVHFGEVKANVVFNSDTLLKVLVPSEPNSEQVKIFIKTPDSFSNSDDFFHFLQPQIEGFYPSQATFSDTISIKGKNFNTNHIHTKVKLDSRIIDALFLSDTLIRFVVPNDLMKSTSRLHVVSEDTVATSENTFKLTPIVFNETKTDTIKAFEDDILITINGTGFNPEIKHNNITVNGYNAAIIEASLTKIIFKLPSIWNLDLNYTFEQRMTITLKVADQTLHSDKLCVLKNEGKWTWSEKASYPGGPRGYAVSFVLDGKGYVGTGFDREDYHSDFYEYNPVNNRWKQIANLPGGGRAAATSYVVNGTAYVGLGTSKIQGESDKLSPFLKKDWYQYDKDNDAWIRMNDFPGAPRHSAYSFVINEIAYVGGGQVPAPFKEYVYLDRSNELWNYNGVIDDWIRLEDGPFLSGGAYVTDGIANIYHGNQLFQYNSGQWTSSEPIIREYDFSTFAIGSIGYLALPSRHNSSGSKIIYAINPNGYSTEIINFPGQRRHSPTTFTINNSAFILLGVSFSSSLWQDFYLDDIFELEISE